jgi:1-acyl-sn-glycerol-3-phosphate acyltransferase
MQRSSLRGFERIAVPLLERLNSSERTKRLLQASLNEFNARWIIGAMSPILSVYHPERATFDAPKGVILVANHLSFFDMYVCASWMQLNTDLVKHVYFPVRANYFYERPDGVLLNLAISGGSMWPPVFRDDERRELNQTGMEQLTRVLTKGSIVGFHPEGSRNKSMDPHTLAPWRPGVGKLIQECDPDVMVLPYFIIGMSNAFGSEIARGRKPAGKRGEPLRLYFGNARPASELRQAGDPLAITNAVMHDIAALAALDKANTPFPSR